MKKIIFLLLISVSALGQKKHNSTNFYLENKKIYWQNIYDVAEYDSISLMNYFKKEMLLSMKLENLQVIDNNISFKIIDDTVDFRKYGGKGMTTAFMSQLPMNYLVVINFKNNKYRVTIKEIYIKDNRTPNGSLSGNIEDFCTENGNTIFSESKAIVKGLGYNNQHFIEKFTLKEKSELNSKW